MSLILAQQIAAEPHSSWAPVVLLIVMGIGFAITNIALSIIVGPKRTGPGKETTYESGMTPIGDTHKRFNVRFYIVAMIFLVFDVEIVFFYPWATLYPRILATSTATHPILVHGFQFSGMLLVEMLIFVVILLIAYFYAWGKGVFRWD